MPAGAFSRVACVVNMVMAGSPSLVCVCCVSVLHPPCSYGAVPCQGDTREVLLDRYLTLHHYMRVVRLACIRCSHSRLGRTWCTCGRGCAHIDRNQCLLQVVIINMTLCGGICGHVRAIRDKLPRHRAWVQVFE